MWTLYNKINIMLQRIVTKKIINDLKPAHVTVLFGARRTGKTVLMESIKERLKNKKILMLNGEDFDVATVLSSGRQEQLKSLAAGYDYLFIDEGQTIPNIGRNLKLLVDSQKETGVFVTGSSSFDLRGQVGEPLTGRSRFFDLYPLVLTEISEGYMDSLQMLPIILVYGSYPQVFNEKNLEAKHHILESIRNGYLLKDVLQLDNLKDSLFVMNLLRLLAFQIGNDISYNEIAKNLGTSVKTIQRYLDILEKAYIIFRLNGFSMNLRKEISKSPRIYFWDNGIRNIVISRMNPLENRDDAGKLWENFCVSERIKLNHYKNTYANHYFWRTYDKQEIDLIEETEGELAAFEMKWGNKIPNVPRAFATAYPNAKYQVINKESFFEFLK